MIVIIYPDVNIWNYTLDGLTDTDNVVKIPLNKYSCKLQVIFRKIFKDKYLPTYFILGKRLRNLLHKLKEGDVVINCDYTEYVVNRAIVDCVEPRVSVKFWMWNPIGSNALFKKDINRIKSLGIRVFTFDKRDAETNEINYINQVFPINKHLNDTPEIISSDFYFLGSDKNRENIIQSLQNVLTEFECYFKIVKSPRDFISYEENIENVKRTRCVVDIVQGCQSGLTLRPLEALTFRKKLVTNNVSIKGYSFYNPQNIFIIGVDPIETINSFISEPYENLNSNVVIDYDVNTWLNNISTL